MRNLMRLLPLNCLRRVGVLRVGITSLLVVCCLAALSRGAAGEIVGYEYTGKVSFVAPTTQTNPPPFGVSVPNGANVIGRFWYDTSVVGTQGTTPAFTNYDQKHWLTLTINPGPNQLDVKGAGFRFMVGNDAPQTPLPPADILSLVFAGDLGISTCLVVNDVRQPTTTGRLQLGFKLPIGTFATTSLPPNLSIVSLPQAVNFLSDVTTGGTDVLFSVQTLTLLAPGTEPIVCPEPTSVVLIAWGALLVAVSRKRLRASKRA